MQLYYFKTIILDIMRTFNIPISFVSSPETEKERLLYTCENVASGFYTRHGYLITTTAVKDYETWSIVIPPEIKSVDSKFWQDSYKYGAKMSKVITKHMYEQTKDLQLTPVSQETLDYYKREWQKVDQKFWQELIKIFPAEYRWIGSVEVRITKNGSQSSHYLLNKKKGEKLILNVREGSPAHEIANLIILSLIFPLTDELGLSFTKRQALRNFVMSRPPFKKLFLEFKPKLYDSLKIPIRLREKSDQYIKYLGIPNIIDPVKTINENVDIFGAKEIKILKELINKNGEILTYDDIADLIWGDGRFKSYWAINKIIQRINKKVKKLEIAFEIKGVRGVGYKI